MKINKGIKLAALIAASTFPLVSQAKVIHTVASFTVLGDIVKQVGGDHVVVDSLVGVNGDPHVFEASPKDSIKLKHADIVFVSGLGLEGWLDRLINASGYQGEVVVTSTGIQTRSMIDDGKKITDPHAWNSMTNGVIYATNVMNALVKADPEDAADITKEGKAYIQKLERLDSWAHQQINAIPQEQRNVLTSHDAFGYFGANYHVNFQAPEGFSSESQASAKGVAKLIKQLKENHIKYYFIENQIDPRLVQQIAQATGAKSAGVLYPEALTTKEGEAPTYTAAFKHNVASIVKSFKS
ncbi:metal ABC transporter solute-binding protein, Zn/Mn family [Vibrio splendidus]|uniref:metal ABC transporter solute-binding protein, Zn/Mn family n=1 Tax=Vibrio splendidus TaxID=29497 RepID=UPI003D11BE63